MQCTYRARRDDPGVRDICNHDNGVKVKLIKSVVESFGVNLERSLFYWSDRSMLHKRRLKQISFCTTLA